MPLSLPPFLMADTMPPNASCQLHHAFSSKRDCVPYNRKPKWKLLALFHVKCFVMATKKGKACVAYPRTIKKAPILYITIFLWVYSLLPRHSEHINSLQHHTQCCFVKEGCNLIFLFLWVICVLSLKACKKKSSFSLISFNVTEECLCVRSPPLLSTLCPFSTESLFLLWSS